MKEIIDGAKIIIKNIVNIFFAFFVNYDDFYAHFYYFQVIFLDNWK